MDPCDAQCRLVHGSVLRADADLHSLHASERVDKHPHHGCVCDALLHHTRGAVFVSPGLQDLFVVDDHRSVRDAGRSGGRGWPLRRPWAPRSIRTAGSRRGLRRGSAHGGVSRGKSRGCRPVGPGGPSTEAVLHGRPHLYGFAIHPQYCDSAPTLSLSAACHLLFPPHESPTGQHRHEPGDIPAAHSSTSDGLCHHLPRSRRCRGGRQLPAHPRGAATRHHRLQGPQLSHGRSVPRRSLVRRNRLPERPRPLADGHDRRRRLGIHRQRGHLGQHLRRVLRGVDRRGQGGRFGPERDLRRAGLGLHPGQHVDRAGRVEVDGRWADLDLHRASRDGADRAYRGASARPRPGLCGRPRSPVRQEPRAGDLPFARRRRYLGACPGAQRLDRRVRSGYGHDQPAHSVCGDVAGGAQAVGVDLGCGRGRRLQDDRRG